MIEGILCSLPDFRILKIVSILDFKEILMMVNAKTSLDNALNTYSNGMLRERSEAW